MELIEAGPEVQILSTGLYAILTTSNFCYLPPSSDLPLPVKKTHEMTQILQSYTMPYNIFLHLAKGLYKYLLLRSKNKMATTSTSVLDIQQIVPKFQGPPNKTYEQIP